MPPTMLIKSALEPMFVGIFGSKGCMEEGANSFLKRLIYMCVCCIGPESSIADFQVRVMSVCCFSPGRGAERRL